MNRPKEGKAVSGILIGALITVVLRFIFLSADGSGAMAPIIGVVSSMYLYIKALGRASLPYTLMTIFANLVASIVGDLAYITWTLAVDYEITFEEAFSLGMENYFWTSVPAIFAAGYSILMISFLLHGLQKIKTVPKKKAALPADRFGQSQAPASSVKTQAERYMESSPELGRGKKKNTTYRNGPDLPL